MLSHTLRTELAPHIWGHCHRAVQPTEAEGKRRELLQQAAKGPFRHTNTSKSHKGEKYYCVIAE